MATSNWICSKEIQKNAWNQFLSLDKLSSTTNPPKQTNPYNLFTSRNEITKIQYISTKPCVEQIYSKKNSFFTEEKFIFGKKNLFLEK